MVNVVTINDTLNHEFLNDTMKGRARVSFPIYTGRSYGKKIFHRFWNDIPEQA